MLLISPPLILASHTHTLHIENEERNSGVEKQKSCVLGAIVNYGKRVVVAHKSAGKIFSIFKSDFCGSFYLKITMKTVSHNFHLIFFFVLSCPTL